MLGSKVRGFSIVDSGQKTTYAAALLDCGSHIDLMRHFKIAMEGKFKIVVVYLIPIKLSNY